MTTLALTHPAWNVLAVVAGVLLLWSKEGPEKLKVFYLSGIVGRLPIGENAKYALQLVTFLAFGAFVAFIMTEPANPRQAFAAGLGWTASFTRRGKV